MKGTLLIKTGNHELAMRSWQRALDLSPGDTNLGRAVQHLHERIVASQPAKTAPQTAPLDPGLPNNAAPLAH